MYVYMIGASVSPKRKQGTTAVAVEKSKKPVGSAEGVTPATPLYEDTKNPGSN
jgi:hypothetical protein